MNVEFCSTWLPKPFSLQAVGTPLLPHQRQALSWMCARENKCSLPPFWEKRGELYFNSLTRFSDKEIPERVRGGILADDMGLVGNTQTSYSSSFTDSLTTNQNKNFFVSSPGKNFDNHRSYPHQLSQWKAIACGKNRKCIWRGRLHWIADLHASVCLYACRRDSLHLLKPRLNAVGFRIRKVFSSFLISAAAYLYLHIFAFQKRCGVFSASTRAREEASSSLCSNM